MKTVSRMSRLSKALNEFHFAVKNVSKDGTNPFFKSKYATLENVVATIKGPLYENALSYAQFPDGDGLYTIIMHESGEWIGAHANLELKGHTPQDQGSAITYMRRYALSAALGLATEDDDDGNAVSTPGALAKFTGVAAKPVPPKQVADKRTVQKARIKELCDEKVLEPLVGGDDYKKYVKEVNGARARGRKLRGDNREA